MKRGISLIILLLCALCLQAQSDLTWIRTKEGRMVAVPKRAVFDLNLPKFTYKSFTPSDRQLIEAKLREFIPDLPVQSAYEQERPMDMIISSAAYQPFFNPYTPMLRRVDVRVVRPLHEKARGGKVGCVRRINSKNGIGERAVAGVEGRFVMDFSPREPSLRLVLYQVEIFN